MNADQQFVSRGGQKLHHAISNFKTCPELVEGLKIENLIILDVGSSTGGFVDCLLQHGAAKVYSVDTAYGELAWKLRNDPRVVVMERTNILHLTELPEKVNLITIDASWTKLELILPVVQKFLKENGYILALLKPHYEAGKNLLVKGVLPEEQVENIVMKVKTKIAEQGFEIINEIESPILGGGGNREFLLLIKPKV